MHLKLIRKYKKATYTIGLLYVNDVLFCNTLEDPDRGLDSKMTESEILSKKIYGETAIPTGKYDITLDVMSAKYYAIPSWREYNGGYMPRLLNVKGFDGILIHPGNTNKDTYGCILVGDNKEVGKVINSRDTFKRLYPIIRDALNKGDRVTIEIE